MVVEWYKRKHITTITTTQFLFKIQKNNSFYKYRKSKNCIDKENEINKWLGNLDLMIRKTKYIL